MFRKVDHSQLAHQLHQLSLSLQSPGQSAYRGWFLVQAGLAEQQQQQSASDSTDIHAGYFFTFAGRVFARTALYDRNEIKYFNAEEFITEAILAFQESIDVSECSFALCFVKHIFVFYIVLYVCVYRNVRFTIPPTRGACVPHCALSLHTH